MLFLFIDLVALIVAFIVSAVFFILWFKRAYHNLIQIEGKTAYGEGWTIGAWFIPLANLVIPCKIMLELYGKAQARLTQIRALPSELTGASVVGWWWTFWIVSSVLGSIVFRAARNAESVQSLIFMTQAEIASSVISILLALITVAMIRKYAKIVGLLRDNFA
jgi:hypothetical protein